MSLSVKIEVLGVVEMKSGLFGLFISLLVAVSFWISEPLFFEILGHDPYSDLVIAAISILIGSAFGLLSWLNQRQR